VTQEQPSHRMPLDTSVASIARIYDYWLGGKDNFAVDRDAAEAMIKQYPDIVTGVRKNRAFLGRAVHYLAAEAGIRQFLDIGTGLPSANNTHEVAQRAAPAGKILQDAAGTLDLTQPVAVCLIMVLQFVPDDDDPWQVVRALMDAMPPGSYLTVAHPASDVDTGVALAFRQLNQRMGPVQVVARSHEQVSRFFDGLDLLDPGLVQLHRWRPGPGADTTRPLAAYGGVARKP
jgi:hypothetical protein